jgi:hypothetical protein
MHNACDLVYLLIHFLVVFKNASVQKHEMEKIITRLEKVYESFLIVYGTKICKIYILGLNIC